MWIARDGVTNVIGQGIASTTNYMPRAWTFDVPVSGVVNAATHPAQVFGAGSLFIRPRGTVLLLR